MSRWLKKSTTINLLIGPFVDNIDGFTPKTALDLVQSDIRIAKEAGIFAQQNHTGGASHVENGWYQIQLNVIDTDTSGNLVVNVSKSGALPVWHEFQVVSSNFFEYALGNTEPDVNIIKWKGASVFTPNFAGLPIVDVVAYVGANIAAPATSGLPDVNIKQISTDGIAADNAESFFDGTGWAGSGNTIPTVTTVNGLASNVITSGTIAPDAIGASELATDAANEIADALLKRDMSAISGEATRSLLNAIRKLINKWSISGTVLTVTKEDDSTTAYTQDITSTPNAGAITGLDTN